MPMSGRYVSARAIVGQFERTKADIRTNPSLAVALCSPWPLLQQRLDPYHFVAVAVMVIAHRDFIGRLKEAVNALPVGTVVQLELANAVLVGLSVGGVLAELGDTLR
jgi:hypothetical protein